jgi:hypothetical protein
MTKVIYFFNCIRPHESLLLLKWRYILSENSIKHLSLIFNTKLSWRLHIKTIEAKAYIRFARIDLLFKSDPTSSDLEGSLHKSLNNSVMTYVPRA